MSGEGVSLLLAFSDPERLVRIAQKGKTTRWTVEAHACLGRDKVLAPMAILIDLCLVWPVNDIRD
jgi:hypothetical protein